MNYCDNIMLKNILSIVKRIMFLIQIIAPILLIIWGSIGFIDLMKNPDEDKKNLKKVINKFIVAAVVFLIPFMVDAVMYMVGDNTRFSSCYRNANEKISTSNSYEEVDDTKKSKIIPNSDDYEKGVKKSKSSDSGLTSGSENIVSSSGYVKGPRVVTTSPYGEALAAKALDLASSAIGTDYLTLEDAKSAGCDLSENGRLRVPAGKKSYLYRAELPQTKNILKFWDEEKERNLGGFGWYGPASCAPWIGSLLRYMGYDQNIATKKAKEEAPVSPWTGERITNPISAHGVGSFMYNHPESFDNVKVDTKKTIKDQALPGDIISGEKHIMIFVGNEMAQRVFPGTTGDIVEATESGRCYPGVTARGREIVGNYKVFRVKKGATVT